MNFLVNLYLSGNKREKVIGNFVLQTIRKHDLNRYSNAIIEGMTFYKDINNFIHEHPTFQNSLMRLNPKMRKNGHQIIHIFYDHFLALNWSNYSSTPLYNFIDFNFQMLLNSSDVLPYKINNALPELYGSHGLRQIHTLEGVHKYMKDLTKVIKVNIMHENALNDLMQNYPSFKNDFNIVFRDLLEYYSERFSKEKYLTAV